MQRSYNAVYPKTEPLPCIIPSPLSALSVLRWSWHPGATEQKITKLKEMTKANKYLLSADTVEGIILQPVQATKR